MCVCVLVRGGTGILRESEKSGKWSALACDSCGPCSGLGERLQQYLESWACLVRGVSCWWID